MKNLALFFMFSLAIAMQPVSDYNAYGYYVKMLTTANASKEVLQNMQSFTEKLVRNISHVQDFIKDFSITDFIAKQLSDVAEIADLPASFAQTQSTLAEHASYKKDYKSWQEQRLKQIQTYVNEKQSQKLLLEKIYQLTEKNTKACSSNELLNLNNQILLLLAVQMSEMQICNKHLITLLNMQNQRAW